MAFPISPTNGQQANINGITYTYSNTLPAWTVSTSVSNTFVSISVSGNVNSGNILNTGLISATGNVTGNYFVGNGSLLTGISGGGGFENRLINGNMSIDQRNSGAAQTITAAAALAYTVDRWYAYSTGANVTGQQIAGTYASSQSLYQFTGAASVTAIGFGQRIEQRNSFDLANTTATLSCYISNSLLTTVTWTASYANTADTFGSLASPTVTQIATGTFTVSSTRTRYTTNISIPSAATTGIQIVFTVGSQTSGTWIVDSIQLEKSATATNFNIRPYGTEQQLCFRYYEVVQAYSYAKGGQFDANAWGFVAQYIAKRVAPTVTASAAFSSPRAATTTAAIITSTAALDGAFIRLSAEL